MAMTFAPRLIYWTVIVVMTYSAGHIASGWVDAGLRDHLSRWPLAIITGLAIGVAVSAVVAVVNWLAFGFWPDSATLPSFLGSIFAIALIIAVVFDLLEHAHPPPADDAIPLLDRLPFDKRSPLIALSVEDHYVRIRTTKGTEMVLMRLSDAIREVGATAGFQAHRSHWVATAAVVRVARNGDRASLTMASGPDIPVSRANMPKLREAGLLPR